MNRTIARLSKFTTAAGLLTGALILPGQADAHHSGAMYDNTKVVDITGPIMDYQWKNPHAIVEVLVTDSSGVQKAWNFECSTPNILVRAGWSAHSLKPGDMVKVKMHPMKDGGPAGMIMAVTTAKGEVLKDHGYVAS